LPYLFRDGERIPGTRLYEPDSDRYDRTRLQRMFDETTTLSLAWLATSDDRYVDHAAGLVRTWFIAAETRMNPHLLYAQIRSQTVHDVGAKSGLIEMKDLYYLLDAVRLIERAGRFSDAEQAGLRDWLREYLEWLQTSDQGVEERLTNNNHGTCFDLQTGSIAAFLGDRELLEKTFFTSRERILEQFTADGRQPHEMKRTQTAHYCCFNLQCWVNLATLAQSCGHDLWSFEGPDGRGLAAAFGWLLPHLERRTWKYEQIEPFDRGRFLPLFFAARDLGEDNVAFYMADAAQARSSFFPHDGIKPFWSLGTRPQRTRHTDGWAALAPRLQRLEPAAYALCHAADTSDETMEMVRDLDKKLWGGFSTTALAKLTAIRDDAEADPKEVNRAARMLARWSYTQGAFDEALANATAMQDLGPSGSRERALLMADCLDRQGETDAARAEIARLLSIFTRDASLRLAMSNLDWPAGRSDDAAGRAAWINGIYRDAHLAKFLDASADGAGIACRATAQAPAEMASGTPRVSVIMTLLQRMPYFDKALTSILGQSVSDLEVLVADCSGDASQAASLGAWQEADPRVQPLILPASCPDHEARNEALTRARGTYVTLHDPAEMSHPDKIREQLDTLMSQEGVATVTQMFRATADGRVLGAWAPDFGYVFDNPTSLFMETAALRALGGWDAVEGSADAFLKWRLEKWVGVDGIVKTRAGVPLSVLIDTPRVGVPAHLDFPFGSRRNAFRGFLRRVRDEQEAAFPNGVQCARGAVRYRAGRRFLRSGHGNRSDPRPGRAHLCGRRKRRYLPLAGLRPDLEGRPR
jgi:glycosyltransferase involved in cell wall biosynthesis